jgi:hypothetical protein
MKITVVWDMTTRGLKITDVSVELAAARIF